MYNEIDKIIIDGQVCLGLPIYNNVRNRIHYGNIKKDWKLYRVKLAKYQENYIEHLNQEYITLLSDKEKIPSEKLWELEKRIKKDRRVLLLMFKNQQQYGLSPIFSRCRLSHEMIWKALAVI